MGILFLLLCMRQDLGPVNFTEMGPDPPTPLDPLENTWKLLRRLLILPPPHHHPRVPPGYIFPPPGVPTPNSTITWLSPHLC